MKSCKPTLRRREDRTSPNKFALDCGFTSTLITSRAYCKNIRIAVHWIPGSRNAGFQTTWPRKSLDLLSLGGCFPITDHVIFSKKIFFYPPKTYSFIYKRLFEKLKAGISQEDHHTVWNEARKWPSWKGLLYFQCLSSIRTNNVLSSYSIVWPCLQAWFVWIHLNLCDLRRIFYW